MAIRFRIDEARGVTFVLWDKTVSLGDWLEILSAQVRNPAWPTPGYLVDMRRVEDLSAIDESDLVEVSSLFDIFGEKLVNIRIAIVAEKEASKTKLFAQLMSRFGPKVVLFDEFTAACSWVGIDCNEAESALNMLRTSSTW